MQKPIAGWIGASFLSLAVAVCAAADRAAPPPAAKLGAVAEKPSATGPSGGGATGSKTASGNAADALAELTPEQQERITNLIVAYCRAGVKGTDTDKLVDSLLDLGGPAARQVRFRCQNIYNHRLDVYRDKFSQAVAKLTEHAPHAPDPAAVAKLRAAVLALRDRPNLTHEMLTDEADPPMKQLRGMVVVLDRQTVLDKNPELKAERERVLALGRQRDRIMARLGDDSAAVPAAGGDAKKQAPPAAPATKDNAKDSKPLTAPKLAAAQKRPADPKPLGTVESLLAEENFVIESAAPMDAASREVMAANAKVSGQLEAQEARAIAACNLTRVALGLSALAIDLKLCAAARDHSDDMHKLGFFAHQSPVPGKENFWDRAKNFGTTASGENIAEGDKTGDQANEAWFHSPGHFRNMLAGSHKRIGVGRNHDLYTEDFGD